MILQHANIKRGPSVWKQPLTWHEFTGSWGTLEAVGPVRSISSGICCCSWGRGARSTALCSLHPTMAATFCLKKSNQQQSPYIYMGNLPRPPNGFGWALLCWQDNVHRRSMSQEMGCGVTSAKDIDTRTWTHTSFRKKPNSVNVICCNVWFCVSQPAHIFVWNVFWREGRIIVLGTFWTHSCIYTHRHSSLRPLVCLRLGKH